MYEVTLTVTDLYTKDFDVATTKLSQSSLDDLLLQIKRNHRNVLCVDNGKSVLFQYSSGRKRLMFEIEKE
jgi:hypothetical protein